MTEAPRARPLAGYVGGKKMLARRLAEIIDQTPHDLYGEVFAGMGGVFFKRRLAPKVEVMNDLSRDVATFFRVLQNHHQAFLDMLRWQLASREEFGRLLGQDPERLTDLQRAARFLYVQRLGFGGKVVGRTFGVSRERAAPFDVHKLAPLIAEAHERLAGVWIECLTWAAFLDRWDRPGALFYLDPPYWGTESYYGPGMFAPADFAALATRLKGLRGRFVMSLNDLPETRETFAGFSIETVPVTYTAGLSNGTRATEIIITGGGSAVAP
ncbi:DNA adenine methylase [Methylopila sp. 73B]|uniref:DNA adenine methylase n=1 Tax=Methylopila sp. 73B TaxID=1120792 RepID=UPI00036CCBA4|nr:DNA adenine methylase [Methylopila sp. 73B]